MVSLHNGAAALIAYFFLRTKIIVFGDLIAKIYILIRLKKCSFKSTIFLVPKIKLATRSLLETFPIIHNQPSIGSNNGDYISVGVGINVSLALQSQNHLLLDGRSRSPNLS